MRRARLISALLLSIGPLLAPRGLAAQWQWTTDLGLSQLKQQGIDESSALIAGTAVDVYGDRAWLRSSALLSRGSEERWTAQGVVLGSLLGPSGHVARWELSGAGSAFTETGAGPTTSVELMAGARFGSPLRGASFGVGGGGTRSPANVDPKALFQAQGSAWQLLEDNAFAVNASFTGTYVPVIRANGSDLPAQDLRSYLDLTGAWRRDHHGWSASVALGGRGASAGLASGIWASGEAAAWVSNHVALVASAGRALEDPIRGVPATRYITGSLRIAAQSHERLGGASRPPIVAGRERIEITLPDARSVELMADFTDWNPVSLVRSGNVWRLERPILPGLHRVAIRIDGGAWTAPPGLPHATDDLGGVVGLINIP